MTGVYVKALPEMLRGHMCFEQLNVKVPTTYICHNMTSARHFQDINRNKLK